MTDLATLGIRFQNEGYDSTAKALDGITDKSAKAEKAVNKFTSTNWGGATATAGLNRQVEASVKAHRDSAQVIDLHARQTGKLSSGISQMTNSLITGRSATQGFSTTVMALVGEAGLAGGAVLGLVGAVVALGVAFDAGQRQSAAFNNAIALTGDYAGMTASDYEDAIARITAATSSSSAVTRSVLLDLVQTGKFTGDAIEAMTPAILKISELTGKTADDVAADFAKMDGRVGDFAIEFQRHYHGITAAQIAHIRLLEDQGKTTEAEMEMATIATRRFAETKTDLGYIEQAWRGVGNAIHNAWESLKGIGRANTHAGELFGIEADIASRLADGSDPNGNGIPELEARATELRRLISLEQDRAAATSAAAQAEEAQTAADEKARKERDKARTSHPKGPTPAELEAMRQEIDLRNQLAAAEAAHDKAGAAILAQRLDLVKRTADWQRAGSQEARTRAMMDQAALQLAQQRGQAAEDEAKAQQKTDDSLKRQLTKTQELAVAEKERLQNAVELEKQFKADQVVAGKDRWAADNDNRAANDAMGIGQDILFDRDNAATRFADMYAAIDVMRQKDVLSEAQAAEARKRIAVQEAEARLQNAQQFFGTLAGLASSSNKTLSAIGKAAAIAQATIDGILAVQKALASAPPPFNYAMAAAVGAVAAANVAQIAGMKDGGEVFGSGGPRDDSELRRLSVGEHVIKEPYASQNRGLLNHINSGGAPAEATRGSPAGGALRVEIALAANDEWVDARIVSVSGPHAERAAKTEAFAATAKLERRMARRSANKVG